MIPVEESQSDGRSRVVVERVRPQIDAGRFPIKRVIGEPVVVEADVFVDGHDLVAGQILHRHANDKEWHSSPMTHLGNDHWRGEFRVSELGRYKYTVEGWIDRLATWRYDLVKRISAGQDIAVECLMGAALLEETAPLAASNDRPLLLSWARLLREEHERAADLVPGADFTTIVQRYSLRRFASRYEKELNVIVDRER